MRLVITIELDNDAYIVDPENPDSESKSGAEVSRQLQVLAQKIDDYLLSFGDAFSVADINGNYTLKAVIRD